MNRNFIIRYHITLSFMRAPFYARALLVRVVIPLYPVLLAPCWNQGERERETDTDSAGLVLLLLSHPQTPAAALRLMVLTAC